MASVTKSIAGKTKNLVTRCPFFNVVSTEKQALLPNLPALAQLCPHLRSQGYGSSMVHMSHGSAASQRTGPSVAAIQVSVEEVVPVAPLNNQQPAHVKTEPVIK